MITPLEELIWHVNYARKTQNERLAEHLEKGHTIGEFLIDHSEWQLDSLIRNCKRLAAQIEEENKKKKTFLQALFRK